jgi:hypothetical protein
MDIYATLFHHFVTVSLSEASTEGPAHGHLQLIFFLIKIIVTKFGQHGGKVVVLTK